MPTSAYELENAIRALVRAKAALTEEGFHEESLARHRLGEVIDYLSKLQHQIEEM